MDSIFVTLFLSLLAVSFATNNYQVNNYDGGYKVVKSGNCDLWKMSIKTQGEDGSFFGWSHYRVVDCTLNFTASSDYDRVWIRFQTYGSTVRRHCGTSYIDFGGNHRCFSGVHNKREYFQLPMSLRYHTESSHGGTAIQAFFTFIKAPVPSCDESVINPEGFISSPSFPKAYPAEVTCQYTFESQMGYSEVYLNFVTFELGGGSNSDCSRASLTVDGTDYCSDNSKPTSAIRLETPATVVFKSGKRPQGKGFKINYVYVPTDK